MLFAITGEIADILDDKMRLVVMQHPFAPYLGDAASARVLFHFQRIDQIRAAVRAAIGVE